MSLAPLIGKYCATSRASHCASTNAATQLSKDKTSKTRPRQAPSNTDISNTTATTQSSTGMVSTQALQGQQGCGQVQLFDFFCRFFCVCFGSEWPDPHTNTLTVFGLGHVNVGFQAGTLQLLAHLARSRRVGKGTH